MPKRTLPQKPELSPLGDVELWRLVRHDMRQWAQSLLGLAPDIEHARTPEQSRELHHLISGVARSHIAMMNLLSLVTDGPDTLNSGPLRTAQLAVLLPALVQELRPLAARTGCTLRADKAEGTAALDGRTLRAVLAGLTLVALKYRSVGDVVLASSLTDRTRFLAISVTFEGLDPAPRRAAQTFIEMAALPSDPGRPFVGLGIPLVEQIARRQGGSLSVGKAGTGIWRMTFETAAAPQK